jgi:NAD(P)-dependent dehydrogenase (short-subunit alcohol dehydrogenase family)
MHGYFAFYLGVPSAPSTDIRFPIPCFSCRANVVIGDIYSGGAQGIVETIKKLPPGSGKAFWKRCDVTVWEEQVALFEFAVSKFGGVDIVVSTSLFTRECP